jgi:hypothetical protein
LIYLCRKQSFIARSCGDSAGAERFFKAGRWSIVRNVSLSDDAAGKQEFIAYSGKQLQRQDVARFLQKSIWPFEQAAHYPRVAKRCCEGIELTFIVLFWSETDALEENNSEEEVDVDINAV